MIVLEWLKQVIQNKAELETVRNFLAELIEGEVAIPVSANIKSEFPELVTDVEEYAQSIVNVQQRLKTREFELRELFSAAKDLSSCQDKQSVLKRLVERTHKLLGSDVTYLSEFNKETDDLEVRFSIGHLTDRFYNLYVPPDIGLASKIVRTKTFQQARSYLESDEAARSEEIDEVINQEGISSIAGVPLMVDEEVVGVLFAANREITGFSPSQISLLTTLANLTSVVMRNVNIIESMIQNSRVDELQINTLKMQSRSLSEVQDFISEITRSRFNDQIQSVTDAIFSTLGVRYEVLNLSDCRDALQNPMLGEEFGAAFQKGAKTGVVEYFINSIGQFYKLCVLGSGLKILGCLLVGPLLKEKDDISSTLIESISLGQTLSLFDELLKVQSVSHLRENLTLELMQGSNASVDSLGHRMADLGFQGKIRRIVFAKGFNLDISVTILDQINCLYAVMGDELILLLSSQVASTKERDILSELDFRRLVEAPIAELREIPTAVQDCRTVIEIADGLGVKRACVHVDQFAPYLSMVNGSSERLLSFIEGELGAILQLPPDKSVALIETMDVYFDANCNLAKTARLLHFHPNTIAQRLEKVTALLGLGWNDSPRNFSLRLAVKLSVLRSSL